jgi:hypothetical protein
MRAVPVDVTADTKMRFAMNRAQSVSTKRGSFALLSLVAAKGRRHFVMTITCATPT